MGVLGCQYNSSVSHAAVVVAVVAVNVMVVIETPSQADRDRLWSVLTVIALKAVIKT